MGKTVQDSPTRKSSVGKGYSVLLCRMNLNLKAVGWKWRNLLSLVATLCSGSSLTAFGSATLQVGCSSSKSCTLIGCGDPLVLSLRLTSLPQDGDVLTVAVCRNGTCISGQFAVSSSALSMGQSEGVSFPSATVYDSTKSDLVGAWISQTSESTAVLTVHDRPWSMNFLNNGDHYTVTLKNAAGDTLASFDQVVNYSSSWPNGPDCDAEPCKTVLLPSQDAGS